MHRELRDSLLHPPPLICVRSGLAWLWLDTHAPLRDGIIARPYDWVQRPASRQKTASGSNAAERNASAATAFVQHRHGDVEDEQQAKQWWAEALGI